MSIKPIDLQVNMAQIHEVGRGEQARTEAVAEQQQQLEKESDEKSRLVNTRLDETKKGESTIIKDEQRKKREEQEREQEASEREKQGSLKKERIVDDKMGKIIDVLK